MTDETLRLQNARLRDKIKAISDRHPELRDLADEIALEQGAHVEVGTPFLERVNGKLQERRAPSSSGARIWNAFSKTKSRGLPDASPSSATDWGA